MRPLQLSLTARPARPRATALSKLVVSSIVVAAGLLGAASTQAAGTQAADAGVLHVAPGGVKGACSAAKPCGSFAQAYAVARPGQEVLVAAGSYAQQQVRAVATHVNGSPVVFRPAGGQVTVRDLVEIYAPDVVVRGMVLNGRARLRDTATGSRLESMRIMSSVLVDASRSAVVGSTITPPPDADGLNVRKGVDVLVQGNNIGPGLRGPKNGHVDCIQIMGGSNVRVLDNVLYRCPSQQLIIKADVTTINDVLVQGNRVIGCGTRDAVCDGYNSILVSATPARISNVRLIDNVVEGAVSANKVPGMVIEKNWIKHLSYCGPWVVNNQVAGAGWDCSQYVNTTAATQPAPRAGMTYAGVA